MLRKPVHLFTAVVVMFVAVIFVGGNVWPRRTPHVLSVTATLPQLSLNLAVCIERGFPLTWYTETVDAGTRFWHSDQITLGGCSPEGVPDRTAEEIEAVSHLSSSEMERKAWAHTPSLKGSVIWSAVLANGVFGLLLLLLVAVGWERLRCVECKKSNLTS